MQTFVYRLVYKDIKFKIYRSILLPVVSYGCETRRSPTAREKHSLWIFKNRAVKRIFRSNRDEVTRGWGGRLNSEELNDPYCSQNIIRMIKSRMMRRAENVARMGHSRVA